VSHKEHLGLVKKVIRGTKASSRREGRMSCVLIGGVVKEGSSKQDETNAESLSISLRNLKKVNISCIHHTLRKTSTMTGNMSKKRRHSATADDETFGVLTVPSAITLADTDVDAPPQKKQQQRRSLFLRSLPASATTESLIAHFSQSFPIKHATAVTDPTTKQCKGYGFVTFADAEDAQKALQEFNGSKLDGKKMKIEVAEPRKRDVEDAIPGAVAAGEGKPRSQPSAASIAAKAQRVKQRQEAARPPKLIIRNLPWSIKKEEQLAALFRSYGKVKHATLPSKKPGLLSGFGFVVLRGQPNAEKAIKEMNGKEIDGRTIAVDWAVEKGVWDEQTKPADEQGVGEDDSSEIEGDDEYGGAMLSGEDSAMSDAENDEDMDVSDEELEDSMAVDAQDDEDDEDEEDEEEDEQPEDISTLFIRNLPFDCDDEALKAHFTTFGAVRYARVVVDPATERPRGTGFVAFFNSVDAQACLRNAPKPTSIAAATKNKTTAPSILQNPDADDPSGNYTLNGRLLQLSAAVSRTSAAKLTDLGNQRRDVRDNDKRRLYLLSEGTVSASSPLHALLSTKEIDMRAASVKQRQQIIRSNGSLHLSLTRLSVRNLPRAVSSKELKALAREAVVGFAKDVKEEKREKLSKEELARGGDEMVAAEKARKKSGKGIVRQAKVVYEGREGNKVDEESAAGRSRGYGFIEFYTHRAALMCLRWLNGHAVGYKVDADKAAGKRGKRREDVREEVEDRKKRVIVEFAIENAQVVHRRSEREVKSRRPPDANSIKLEKNGVPVEDDSSRRKDEFREKAAGKRQQKGGKNKGNMRKGLPSTKAATALKETKPAPPKDDKMAMRNRVIGKKRAMRKGKKGGA